MEGWMHQEDLDQFIQHVSQCLTITRLYGVLAWTRGNPHFPQHIPLVTAQAILAAWQPGSW